MCRILFLKGTNKQKALKYIDGLYESGKNDPFLEKFVGHFNVPKIKNQHTHGWGYLLVTPKSIKKYLNGDSFLDDKKGFNELKTTISDITGEFVLMVELRMTDEGYISSFESHPFYFMSKNGFEGYFFYNGFIDHEKLAKLEGLNYSDFKYKNGTTLMGYSFSNALENGKILKDAIQSPKRALKSGYNIMAFVNDNKGNYKAVLNAFTHEDMICDKVVYDYGKIIKKEEEDLFFAGSSPIEIYMPEIDFQTMENGEYIEFDIDWIQKHYFDAYR